MKCLKITIVTDICTQVLQELPHWDINACKSDMFQIEMLASVSSFILFYPQVRYSLTYFIKLTNSSQLEFTKTY